MAFVFENSAAPAAKAERAKTKIWLNIGYHVGNKFVNLPVGIPLDTTAPVEIRGQNEDWNKFQTARNGLLEALTKMGMSLEPGAEDVIEGLVIKVKHVAEPATVDAENNEYVVDFNAMLKGKQKKSA